MSWREILKAKPQNPSPEIPKPPQFAPAPNSGDIGICGGAISGLILAPAERAEGVGGFTLAELEAAAGADWPAVRDRPEALDALSHLLTIRALRERGERPGHYTRASTCAACGPVWLWEGAPARVLGCPWCFNRVAGRPIPRPDPDATY